MSIRENSNNLKTELEADAEFAAMESEHLAIINEIAKEIDSKKLVPMELLLEVLKDHSPFCSSCDAEDGTYLDCSGQEPVIRCLWCKKEISIKKLAQKARSLPCDYMGRKFRQPAEALKIETIGNDVWIIDGCIAELVGDERISYPDRDKCKPTNAISEILAKLDMTAYEPAKIGRVVYRPIYDCNPLYAVLKSKNHITYIDNDFVKFVDGYQTPYICGELQPVIVKSPKGIITTIVMPVRFTPKINDDIQQI